MMDMGVRCIDLLRYIPDSKANDEGVCVKL